MNRKYFNNFFLSESHFLRRYLNIMQVSSSLDKKNTHTLNIIDGIRHDIRLIIFRFNLPLMKTVQLHITTT